MSMLPTASALGRAMRCVASTVLPRVESVSEAAEAGTAKHAYLAAMVDGFDHATAIEQVPERFRAACEVIPSHLVEDLRGLETEVAYAWSVVGGARRLGTHLERAYVDAKSYEFVGTLDYSGVDEQGVGHVYDLKTGQAELGEAKESWQLRFGAVALAAATECHEVQVGFLQAPEGRRPRWVVDRFSLFELLGFERELGALRERVEDARADVEAERAPQMTTGSHCEHCPCRLACPAHVGIIRSAVADAGKELDAMRGRVEAMTSDELSTCWAKAKPFLDASDALRSAFRNAAKSRPFATGPGMVLGLHEVERTELDGEKVFDYFAQHHSDALARVAVTFEASKASISRALKEVAKETGGKLAPLERETMAELASRGALTRKTTQRLEEHRAGLPPPHVTADSPPALEKTAETPPDSPRRRLKFVDTKPEGA